MKTVHWLPVLLLCLGASSVASAQHRVSVSFVERDFTGDWLVVPSGQGTATRIDSGGCGVGSGPFYRTTVSTRRPSCNVGAPRDYVSVIRVGAVYDPAELGTITRFDSGAMPRVLDQVNSSFSWVTAGIVLEQDGYLFGVGTFNLPGSRSPQCEPCTHGCGDGPIPPGSLRPIPGGRPGGPQQPDLTPSGAPFRMGFYTAVETPGHWACTLDPVSDTVDIDDWGLNIWSCPPPPITSQPASVVACAGTVASFVVASPGTPRWRRDGVPLSDLPDRIEGSTTARLTLLGVTESDAGTYDCALSGECNPTFNPPYRVSSPATLTVAPPCDINNDGGADLSDVIEMADLIASGRPVPNPVGCADFNGDGGADSADVIDLADAVAGGACP